MFQSSSSMNMQNKALKINMNLDSIHRLIEETEIFQMQQASRTARGDREAPAPCAREPCGSCWPPCAPQARAAHAGPAPALHANRWDIGEELRLRELEEVKARAAQMEKTMRWWSDCTANWREKWSKVRAERNSAREESRQLRVKLEMAAKELSALKKKHSLPLRREAAEAAGTQDPRRPSVEGSCHNSDQLQKCSPTCGSVRDSVVERPLSPQEDPDRKEEGVALDPLRVSEEVTSPDCTDLFRNGGFGTSAMKLGPRLPTGNVPRENAGTEVSLRPLCWEDLQEILCQEREMRATLEKEVERLQSAVSLWKGKYEELREFTAANGSQFDVPRGQPENEKGGITGEIKEDSTPQESQDRVISELGAEVHLESSI